MDSDRGEPRPRRSLPLAPRAPKAAPALRHLPLLQEARDIDRAFRPIYAVWETTLRCDLACAHCGSRFEVWHTGDPLAEHTAIEVRCPCCGASTPVTVPRGAEKDLRVDNLPGPEPETGVVD